MGQAAIQHIQLLPSLGYSTGVQERVMRAMRCLVTELVTGD